MQIRVKTGKAELLLVSNDKWSILKSNLDHPEYEFIGLASQMTEEMADAVCESFISLKWSGEGYDKSYRDYIKGDKIPVFRFKTALESFHSLMRANNIDNSKEWIILKVK